MKIVTILNPVSGNKNIEFLKEELYRRFQNFDFEIWESEEPRHAINLAQKAAKQNCNIVISAGGDGTVAEIISGIIDTPVKLGIIPYGTGNMFASNIGIPLNNVSRAIDIIMEGKTKKIDIGHINGRYFSFMAGCGFDAKIIDEVSRVKKRKYGLLAYYFAGIKQLFTTKYASFHIKIDNKKVIKTRALTVIIANSAKIIGNMLSLAPNTSISDGFLDVIIISPKYGRDYFHIIWNFFTKKANTSEKVKHYRVKEIEIRTKPHILVQADGDIIDITPIKVKILPLAIEVIAPI